MPLLWMHPTSTAIRMVGYDPFTGDLRIIFWPRPTAYLWKNVGLSVIFAMFEARSLGAWVRLHLVGRGQGKENARVAMKEGVQVGTVRQFFEALLDLGIKP